MPPASQKATRRGGVRRGSPNNAPRRMRIPVGAEGDPDEKAVDFCNPIEWCKHNEYLFTENCRILKRNKEDPMRQMVEAGMAYGATFLDTSKGECKASAKAVEEMENADRDCEYTAYFHFFVAKQNRAKSYEMFNKWRDNVAEYLEHRSEYKEGQYLRKSKEQMDKVKTNENMLKLMDAMKWWDFRIMGAKVYKSVCSDPRFFKK